MATLTLSVITFPDLSVALHFEPLHLARTLLSSTRVSNVEIPELGAETENGRVYDPEEIEHVESSLTAALEALDDALPAEEHFNDRQELRAALRIFGSARAHRCGVELGV